MCNTQSMVLPHPKKASSSNRVSMLSQKKDTTHGYKQRGINHELTNYPGLDLGAGVCVCGKTTFAERKKITLSYICI